MTTDHPSHDDQGTDHTDGDIGATGTDDEQGRGPDDRSGSEPGRDGSPEPQLDPDSPGATIDDPEPAEPNEPG